MSESANAAGGRATETGMAFQAAVTSWFAAQMLADVPIGSALGLSGNLKISGIQCETGDAIDDIVVRLDRSGTLYVQCKTRPTMAAGAESPLAQALAQLVSLYVRMGRRSPHAEPVYALLAVAEDAPRTLNTLESACRLFDHGGVWSDVMARATADVRGALAVFEAHVRSAWPADDEMPLEAEDLVSLARLFRIRRFSEETTGDSWRGAAHLLGRALYGVEAAGEAPMDAILARSRNLIRTGAPLDRPGLLRALRAAGHADVLAPGYDRDIEVLRAYSREERKRLSKHMSLSIDGGIPIPRDCHAPLRVAVEAGSLLVTGEPGAGKTGVLLAVAEELGQGPGPVLFLSVERFSGCHTRGDVRSELELEHDLIEVLSAWPGPHSGVLFVDALDASRGGPSEPLIASLIEDAVRVLGARWSIVASIRSFDLRSGRRFRELMPGVPPNPQFAEHGLGGVRHFLVKHLSATEVAAVAAASPRLRELEESAPCKLKELLRNIFNLSLAAELLSAGEEPKSIRGVATQSELIRRYEDVRIPTQAVRLAAKAAVTAMVARRQLTVRATDIENNSIEEVRQAGVLASAGDRVAFAHHVLFDHIAARFFLAWDDPAKLRVQITQDPTLGLMLGPALRFALEEMWQADQESRPTTWHFLADLTGVAEPHPVVLSIALRTAAERVEGTSDVDALCELMESDPNSKAVGQLGMQLARFVGMAAAEGGKGVGSSAADAWGRVALVASRSRVLRLVDAARVLLMTLAEQADLAALTVANRFGEAARALLASAWSMSPEHVALNTAGIRFVARSYGTDPDASRLLLSRILDDRFDEHAPQEAMWLAEGVASIVPHDPAFISRVYEVIFTREVTDEAKTWLGGSPTRILPLSSTRRQDYQHARWQLNQALSEFLRAAPLAGTKGVIGAVRGIDVARQHDLHRATTAPIRLNVDGQSLEVIDDYLSLQDWREEHRHEEGPLDAFVEFLRDCSREAFREAVGAAIAVPTNAAVWARLLGVAAERPGVAEDLLWPLATCPQFTLLQGVSRDAVIFLAAAYPHQPAEARSAFEASAIRSAQFTNERERKWWDSVLERYLSEVPEDMLITAEMRTRRSELAASGELTGNPPFVSMKLGWGSNDDAVEGLLRSQGADLERSPNREIRAASRKLEDRLKQGAKDQDAQFLAGLWADLVGVVKVLDERASQQPHQELVRSTWGAVSNAVECVAKSDAYSPAATGLPELDTLLALIDRLAASPYPERTEARDSADQMMSWGNWDVRVYAASSLVALAPKFAGAYPQIIDRMAASLSDPSASVRNQVAQALNVLWDVARDRMWSLAEKVASEETHEGVLRFFVAGSLSQLARGDPTRAAAVLEPVLTREWAGRTEGSKSTRRQDVEAHASLVASLYVARNQEIAWKWIERWASELRFGEAYIVPMLGDLQPVFFFPYAEESEPSQIDMATRARRLLDRVVDAAGAAVAEARPHLLGTPLEEAIATWRPIYEAGDGVLHGICNQFYFGSGAFKNQGDREEAVGLKTSSAKRRFLADHARALDAIAAHAQAGTVHQLFELLAFLVDGDPPGVFDRIASVLLGPAAEDNYQFESLGLDSLVRLVRLYLADYRQIFEDEQRRRTLVDVLELFSSAGWPEALKLLFELPDLLR